MHIKKYIVALEKSEAQQLMDIVRKGAHSARVITRARVLLMANVQSFKKTDKEICDALNIVRDTTKHIRKKYKEGGIQKALFDAPRPGGKKRLSCTEEAQLISLACTDAPQGYSHWTLDLLKERINTVLKNNEKPIGRTTVWRILIKNDLKPWREKNVVYKADRQRISRQNDGCVGSI